MNEQPGIGFLPYSPEDIANFNALVQENPRGAGSQPGLALPFGFNIPYNREDWPPVPLRTGGTLPTLSEQYLAYVMGQDSGNGFNLGGLNLSLPAPLNQVLRTHTSAGMAFLYRNGDATQREMARRALDIIHPGMTAEIDSEVYPGVRELVGPPEFQGNLIQEGIPSSFPDLQFTPEQGKARLIPSGDPTIGIPGGSTSMSMSKSRRRRMRQSRGQRMDAGSIRRDWIVGGTLLGSSGAISGAANVSSWGDLARNIVTGNGVSYQLASLPVVAPSLSAPPPVGEVSIDAVQGSVFIHANSAGGVVAGTVSIYRAKQNTGGASWDVRQPSVSSDAQRDDYFYLRPFSFTAPASSGLTDYSVLEIPVMMSRAVLLGGGEALHLTIDSVSGATINIDVFVRSCISRVN